MMALERWRMNPLAGYLPKMNAVAYISIQTGAGRPTVERMIHRLQDEGRITPVTTNFSRAILYSPEDIELVIRVLKGEDK